MESCKLRYFNLFEFFDHTGSLFGPKCVSLAVVVLWLGVLPVAPATRNATGSFEVYCDSFGFFLEKVEGAPAPGEFFLLLYRGFPGFVDALPGGEALDVSVYPKGCHADSKCDSVANGKLWLDSEHVPGGTQISGKYDIDWHGQHLKGQFLSRRRKYKKPPRICM
ncbi:MAG TPA: hypothetical protein VIX91_12175 [Candidatus Acidoferrum sp.]